MKLTLEPAFILHTRPWRETSLIVECLTQSEGRISCVAKGARRKRTQFSAQLFMPFLLSAQGSSELLTLTTLEPQGVFPMLQGKSLLCAFYLNELLLKLLEKQDPHPETYHLYQKTLSNMRSAERLETELRLFEKRLLSHLGYGLTLSQTADLHQAVLPEKTYAYSPERGVLEYSGRLNVPEEFLFQGKVLLDLSKECLESPESLKAAKRLLRMALAAQLGSYTLQTRSLF